MKERAIENEKSVRTAMGLEDLEDGSDDDDSGRSRLVLQMSSRPNEQSQKLGHPKPKLPNTMTKTD